MSSSGNDKKVRKAPRTNWIYEIYRVPNPLTGEMLICDASLERDFALKNIFDPDVIYIDTKPQSCLIQTNGHRYTRDAVIGRKDKSITHCEVKTSSDLKTPKNKRKFKAIAQEFDDAGSSYEFNCGI